jgi:putative two-component system response regulator
VKKTKPLVLIVDDDPTNIDLLVNTLKDDYRLGGSPKMGQKHSLLQKNFCLT